MNLALFYVREGARIWAHWNQSFDMLLSDLKPESCFPHPESSWGAQVGVAAIGCGLDGPSIICSLTGQATFFVCSTMKKTQRKPADVSKWRGQDADPKGQESGWPQISATHPECLERMPPRVWRKIISYTLIQPVDRLQAKREKINEVETWDPWKSRAYTGTSEREFPRGRWKKSQDDSCSEHPDRLKEESLPKRGLRLKNRGGGRLIFDFSWPREEIHSLMRKFGAEVVISTKETKQTTKSISKSKQNICKRKVITTLYLDPCLHTLGGWRERMCVNVCGQCKKNLNLYFSWCLVGSNYNARKRNTSIIIQCAAFYLKIHLRIFHGFFFFIAKIRMPLKMIASQVVRLLMLVITFTCSSKAIEWLTGA